MRRMIFQLEHDSLKDSKEVLQPRFDHCVLRERLSSAPKPAVRRKAGALTREGLAFRVRRRLWRRVCSRKYVRGVL